MRSSGYNYEDNGFYQEPTWFVEALIKVEDLSAGVYDPFCGEGTIPKTCIKHGIDAIGSEITDRGYGKTGVNFFDVAETTSRNIVMNPDYKCLKEAIDHALWVSYAKIAVVARLGFLASQKRREWFKSLPLARIWIASQRPSMPPGGKNIKASGGSIEFCWLVFDRTNLGLSVSRPTVDWLPIMDVKNSS